MVCKKENILFFRNLQMIDGTNNDENHENISNNETFSLFFTNRMKDMKEIRLYGLKCITSQDFPPLQELIHLIVFVSSVIIIFCINIKYLISLSYICLFRN